MDESTEVARGFVDKIKAFAKSHLYSKQSDFQKIDIIDTYEFGTEKGILINQCESPYYPLNSKEMKRSFNKLNSLFPICEAYQ